jgi:hypothetical protein
MNEVMPEIIIKLYSVLSERQVIRSAADMGLVQGEYGSTMSNVLAMKSNYLIADTLALVYMTARTKKMCPSSVRVAMSAVALVIFNLPNNKVPKPNFIDLQAYKQSMKIALGWLNAQFSFRLNL